MERHHEQCPRRVNAIMPCACPEGWPKGDELDANRLRAFRKLQEGWDAETRVLIEALAEWIKANRADLRPGRLWRLSVTIEPRDDGEAYLRDYEIAELEPK